MKIIATYEDGSQTKLYEPGDRVRYTGRGDWFCQPNEVGTVIGYEDTDPNPYTTRLLFQPDQARDTGFGSMAVPPWFLQPFNP